MGKILNYSYVINLRFILKQLISKLPKQWKGIIQETAIKGSTITL